MKEIAYKLIAANFSFGIARMGKEYAELDRWHLVPHILKNQITISFFSSRPSFES